MVVLQQQLELKREQIDKEINVVFNELYVRVNSLPMSENIHLPFCCGICDTLFDTPQMRKR
jgi:hypothetical protein